jgi:outer membrane immunogenic protein
MLERVSLNHDGGMVVREFATLKWRRCATTGSDLRAESTGEIRMSRLLLAGLAFSALIMPAMAADMLLKAPPPPPTWTGLYWGVNVGWVGSSQSDITNTGTDTGVGGLGAFLRIGAIPGTIAVSHSGFIGGGQIGYNWQTDPN